MAILELVVNQAYFNQLVVNRYHFVSSGTPAAVSLSFGLISAAGYIGASGSPPAFVADTLAGRVQGIQASQLTYVSAFARDLYSVTDFYERPYITPVPGGLTGSGATPAVSLGFKGSRIRTDIRRGMKRYAGVREEDMDAGGVVASAIQTALGLVADLLGEVLEYDDDGNTLSYTPVVLGLEKYTTPSGHSAYRPYATEAAQLDHVAAGGTWSPYTTVRTQVSRQYGRGA